MQPLRRALPRAGRIALVAEFAVISSAYITIALFVDRGGDAHIYYRATEAWLSGGDPWSTSYAGVVFAAPPPTLLFMAPFSLFPEHVAVALLMGLSLVSAVFVTYRLRLRAYWLLFPPMVESVTVGNPDIIVLALLLGPAAAIAVIAKLYAAVPLFLLARWKPLMMAALALLATAPILPWDRYLSADVISTLNAQSGGRSAFEIPWLLPFTLVALWRLGRARSAWLAVPALWPSTQLHYGVLAMPAIAGVIAFFMAIPLPGSAAVGVIAGAIAVEIQNRLSPPAAGPAPPP